MRSGRRVCDLAEWFGAWNKEGLTIETNHTPPLPYYSSFNVTTLTVTEYPQILARLGHQACTHTYTTDVPDKELH
jgi:hypothetical protein